jgi:8-oxoguanine deaminase
MIAGEWRVAEGQPIGLDLSALIAEHQRAARDFA